MTFVPSTGYDSSGGASVPIVKGFDNDSSLRSDAAWPQALLRTVRAGSAGVVVIVTGYSLYFPHVGTSPSIVDSRIIGEAVPVANSAKHTVELASTGLRAVLVVPFGEQLRELLAALSLNKSQFSEVFGVSRPTLYDWLDGERAERLQRTTPLDLARAAS